MKFSQISGTSRDNFLDNKAEAVPRWLCSDDTSSIYLLIYKYAVCHLIPSRVNSNIVYISLSNEKKYAASSKWCQQLQFQVFYSN